MSFARNIRLPFSKEKAVKNIFIISFLAFLIWLLPNLGKILFIILLIGSSILIGLHRKIIPFYLGIELITFSTVVTCFIAGPIMGMIAAIIILSAQAIMTGHITIHYFLKLGIYFVVVLFCALAQGLSIGTVGKIVAIFVNVAYLAGNAVLGDAQGLMDAPGNVVNVFLNFWLFGKAAELVMLFDA